MFSISVEHKNITALPWAPQSNGPHKAMGRPKRHISSLYQPSLGKAQPVHSFKILQVRGSRCCNYALMPPFSLALKTSKSKAHRRPLVERRCFCSSPANKVCVLSSDIEGLGLDRNGCRRVAGKISAIDKKPTSLTTCAGRRGCRSCKDA